MQRQRNGYVEPVHWMASSRGEDIDGENNKLRDATSIALRTAAVFLSELGSYGLQLVVSAAAELDLVKDFIYWSSRSPHNL